MNYTTYDNTISIHFSGDVWQLSNGFDQKSPQPACPGVEPEQAGQCRNGILIIDLLKTGGLIPVCHNFVMDGLAFLDFRSASHFGSFFKFNDEEMRSTGHVSSHKAWCSSVISCYSTALIGAFRSLLFTQWFAPSAVRCRTALLLLWFFFFIVGFHASEISIPLSTMLLGLSLIWIASLTLRV